MNSFDGTKIEEIVRSSIAKFLNEEQGVAEIASYETNEIVRYIRDNVMGFEKIKYNDYVVRKHSFNKVLFNEIEVTINLMFYNFLSYEAYEDFIYNNSNIFIGKSSFDRKTIILTFFGIFGEIDEKSLEDQCQHEVSHLYRRLMKNGPLLSSKRRSLYALSNDLMNSQNEYDKMVGTIVYASFEEEQNAFVNGMYALLASLCIDSGDENERWKESDAYILFSKLKYYESILESGNLDNEDYTNIQNSLSKLGSMNIEWLKHKLSLSIKSFGNKIIKGFNKATNDLNKIRFKKGYMN